MGGWKAHGFHLLHLHEGEMAVDIVEKFVNALDVGRQNENISFSSDWPVTVYSEQNPPTLKTCLTQTNVAPEAMTVDPTLFMLSEPREAARAEISFGSLRGEEKLRMKCRAGV